MKKFKEVAEHFGVTKRTVFNWEKRGMPSFKVGSEWRVESFEKVESWLKEEFE